MIFGLYLAVFLTVMFFRSRSLQGQDLRQHSTARGVRYLETKNFNNKGHTVSARLGVSLGCNRYFSITREKWYHRLLKSMNLATEMETGDAALDEKLFFTSDQPERLQDMFRTPAFIDAVRKLFNEYGVVSLRAFGDKLWVQTKSMESSKYTADLVAHYLEPITAIAGVSIDANMGTLDQFKPLFGKPQISLVMMLCHAAAFFIGIFAVIPLIFESYEIVNTQEFILKGAAAGVVCCALWLLVILSLLRGSGWIALVLADFVIMGIVGIGLSAAFITRDINISLDRSEATMLVQPTTAKACSLTCKKPRYGRRRSSSSHTYALTEQQCLPENQAATIAAYRARDYKCNYTTSFKYKITVKKWRDDMPYNYTFPASQQTFVQTRLGDTFSIPAHPGALGLEWVDTDEIQRQ